ncbi:hypothetical protein NIES4071_23700 [Calothrix sp. NIES-4071]|nr:hypothetical protein NIES4071_23700 [Calothrix sp. NIES-4071]BAZ56694.1 hypothetical protein NIES4105_23650 [Calothrix sp. NIES-4105]
MGKRLPLVYYDTRSLAIDTKQKSCLVFSYDESTDTGYVVTAYVPDLNVWSDDFRVRR